MRAEHDRAPAAGDDGGTSDQVDAGSVSTVPAGSDIPAEATPYATAAHAYLDAGWHPLPILDMGKGEVPAGFTGYAARKVTGADISRWVDEQGLGDRSVCLRLMYEVGIDIDSYDDTKTARADWDALVAKHGEPPPTVRVSSRFGADYDGLAGIKIYRLPVSARSLVEQRIWKGQLGSGIDSIRLGHRQVVAWPSIHPMRGTRYQYLDERTGQIVDGPLPPVDTIPELTEEWVQVFIKPLVADSNGGQRRQREYHGGVSSQWWTDGVPCQAVNTAMGQILRTLPSGHHDGAKSGLLRLTRLGEQGHEGVQRAVDQLLGAFVAAVDGTRGEPALDEWNRMLPGLDGLIAADGLTPEDKRGCCRASRTTTVPNGADDPPPDDLDDPATGQYYVARRLVQAHPGRYMFVPGIGWYIYDGTRWDAAAGLAEKLVEQAVVDAGRAIIADAANIHAKELREQMLRLGHRTLSSDNQIRGAVAMATRHPDVLVGIRDLDPDPYRLNVANGTLDLLSGQLSAHNWADRLTKVTAAAYLPGTDGQRWPLFLNQALGDPRLIRAVQQLLGGPALMGTVLEHVLPMIYGPTGSGKGTFINATSHALGDYAISAEPDLVMKRAGAHPTGEMDLLGVRLAFVSESDEGRQLASATMKRLTGGDKIRARKMRGDFVQFDPSHLLVLITNHLPVMPAGDDPAIWRRVRVVPFDRPPDTVDKRLPEHLKDEADAILTWMVAGFADYWKRQEIDWPDSVLDATKDYRSGSDLLAAFLDETSVTVDQAATEPMGAVYKRWRGWLADNAPDTRPGRVQDLKRALLERGEAVRDGTSRNKGSVLAGRMFLADADDKEPQWTP